MPFAVKKRAVVQDDTPLVRRFEAGNDFERHGLAGARRTQKSKDLVADAEVNLKREVAQKFFDLDVEFHSMMAAG